MNILYVSTLLSQDYVKELFNKGYEILQSIQKFNHLLTIGFNKNNCKVDVLSNVPVTKQIKKTLYRRKENENGINFFYCSKVSFGVIGSLIAFICSFHKTFRWIFNNNRKDSIVILDVLNFTHGFGSLIACKILRIRTLGIVTDISGLKDKMNLTLKEKVYSYLVNHTLGYYDSYIFLTEAMNKLINSKGKPYLIMEGLVDFAIESRPDRIRNTNKKIVMYAGGLTAQYGLWNLISGFSMIESNDVELHLYGYGDMINEIKEYCKKDLRIKYFGEVHNDTILDLEMNASLLVNPRPTNEEYTKYSFPSKNMEYMASGTPLLTTALPGIPFEYYPYVYLLEDESAEGVFRILQRLLIETPQSYLIEKGLRGREFVVKRKNNILQAARILEFISNSIVKKQ